MHPPRIIYYSGIFENTLYSVRNKRKCTKTPSNNAGNWSCGPTCVKQSIEH